MKSELTKYSELAWGRQDKNFVIPVLEFPSLYREFCARFYFAPVNQQLIESIFSKVNGCILSTDPPEIDALRIGQYRSKDSRAIFAAGVSASAIREKGKVALSAGRKDKKRKAESTPCARHQRKRLLETDEQKSSFLNKLTSKATTRVAVLVHDSQDESIQGGNKSDGVFSTSVEESCGE